MVLSIGRQIYSAFHTPVLVEPFSHSQVGDRPMNKYAAPSLAVLACLTATARADVPPSPNPPRPFVPQKVEFPLVLTPGAKEDPQMYVRLPAELCPQGHADARNDRGATLVAGVALTVAFSLAGLWLARGGRRRLHCEGHSRGPWRHDALFYRASAKFSVAVAWLSAYLPCTSGFADEHHNHRPYRYQRGRRSVGPCRRVL